MSILAISASFVYAQKLTPNSIVRVNATSFITNQNDSQMMIVFNSRNQYHNKIPKVAPTAITSVERMDNKGMLKAFTGVFSDSRIQQLLPERFIQMQCYVNASGQILEIEFYLNKNTLITGAELQALEKAIKHDVIFKLRPQETKGGDFFVIAQAVKFSRVLNKTLQ